MKGSFLMKLGIISTLLASLFGCKKGKINVSDGPGMIYHESDHRTEYSRFIDFDSAGKDVYFAIVFLGNEVMVQESLETVTERFFSHLSQRVRSSIEVLDFGGDSRYLVIPRYKDHCDVKVIDTNKAYTVYNGEAFVVCCAEKSIEISVDSHGGNSFILGEHSNIVMEITK